MRTDIFKGDYPVSSPYGWRTDPITGLKVFHNGIDYSMPIGVEETVPASFNGAKVRLSTTDSYGGLYIQLIRADGKGCYWLHNSKNLLKVGTTVKTGDVVGLSGNSGNTTGAHIHFGVQSKATVWGSHEDPTPYISSEDEDMQYKKGDKLLFNNSMNLRNGDGEVKGAIVKGAVCEIISDKLGSLPEEAGEWDYYNVKFLDDIGYVADTDRNELTTKDITNIDGSIPVEPPEVVDCTKYIEQIEDLKKEIEILESEIEECKEENEILEVKIEDLEGIIRNYQIALAEITGYK